MKIALLEKVLPSMTHFNLVQKFIPMPQAMKIPYAKDAVENGKKLETIPAWDLGSQERKGGYSGSTKRQKKVHFASKMDICHLKKNAELEPKLQRYKGRVVLQGDIVKDDSGPYAVFTEQGSSASQITAAKIMDVIARLPGCDGQVADAVSAYTQVKLEDASRLLKIPKAECPDDWVRRPRHTWPKSWSNIEDPVVPLERNLYGHPLAGFLWERQFEETLLEFGWEKAQNWECMFIVNKGSFCQFLWMTSKRLGKKQNVALMCKKFDKKYGC